MNAEIIGIGSELLLGQIANTNAQFISQRLADLGINVFYHTVVGDNHERLKQAIEVAQTRSDLLVFTGGLGPTKDDLTKETIAETLNKQLVYNEEAMKTIQAYYDKTGAPMSENNRKQALVLEGAAVLRNDNGMAPGMALTENNHTYMLFPGPPKELYPMFTNYAEPYLLGQLKQGDTIVSRVLRFFGIGESRLETELEDLIDQQTNPTIAPLAGEWEVTLRLTAKADSKEEANKLIDETEKKIHARVGTFLYGYGETSLPKEVFSMLKDRNWSISTAESLTGGMFSQELTDLPGVSSLFYGGVVCYSNEVKREIGVSKETLEAYGAVSEECAIELARSVKAKYKTDVGISFTGVAGPDPSEGKDAGTVYIGVAAPSGENVVALNLAGNRNAIRKRTVKHGFNTLLKLER
ncbi:competence/damage-inducible protein A [Pseudalkalibacillus hwajinpoensis]|uniref:competence/damage-inducible protein A n=1 Tax=Guptibacillus hwajinpoensis TaxID=208199 RepID=UPI001CD5081F|nr:competence/damage-inducible protein A [Pseudalkalibacillus hwajinpoensis]MCA0990265.1 competence/damage-inducible protein A [Pseudalkalibacillus hwajinpoensis]